jgi:tetratricopeptide (TPR) repeat protein
MRLYVSIKKWEMLYMASNQVLSFMQSDQIANEFLLLSKKEKSRLDMPIEQLVEMPTAENFLNLSLEFYQAGMFNKCIEACYQAIKIKPNFPEAYNNICSAYNQLKQWDNAIKACFKAMQQKPGYQLAKNNYDWAVLQRDSI